MTDHAPSGVGEALAQARQNRGLALSDVAQQLKFAPRHIEALEQERFDALPGGTFARGMVRSYARLLKLEEAPLLERLEGRFTAPDADEITARFQQPVPFSDSGRRSTLVYLGLSVAVLALVGLTAYQWHREASAPPAVAVVEPARPAAARPPAPAQAVKQAPKPAIETVQAPSPAAAVPDSAPAVPPAGDAPGSDASRSDAPKSLASSRIVLRCDEESWIEVKDAADRVLISSLNAAGTERVVQGRPPFSLIIGNAQHVRVSYNDQPVDLHPHIKVEVARFTLN